MSCPSSVAMGIVLPVDPGRFEFTAGARALLIHSAAHTAPDITHQTHATRRLGFSSEHRDVERAHLHSRMVRNHTTG